jgi:hypothetical protein
MKVAEDIYLRAIRERRPSRAIMANRKTVPVPADLVGQKTYHVRLDLTVVALPGQSSVPDDYTVSRVELSRMSGMVVEDGNYLLRYTYYGKTEEQNVRVQNGTLLKGVAA